MESPPGTGDGAPAALFEHLQREGERQRGEVPSRRASHPHGPHGGLSSSSSPSTGAHRGVLLCQPEWWVAHTLLPGLCPARPTPACQHLPGHAEPGQSAQHTREGVWPPVGARALSPEGRERREGCRLCSTTSVLLGAKSSLRFIPVGLRPGQPLSAFEPGP